MITAINHVTLAVSDLERSLVFYTQGLGFRLAARWARGAYLEAGSVWLCLSWGDVAPPRRDGTHLAFTVARGEFSAMAARVLAAGGRPWKDNTSEGDSLYVLDPDGHALELHVGSLASRLEACRHKPYDGMVIYDDA